jgi:hypothetical protein
VAFGDVERRLSLYLRALWGREIRLRPLVSGGRSPGLRPTLDGTCVWLPLPSPDSGRDRGLEFYRAAAAPAAAHVVFTRRRFATAGLSALQVALVSLIEDARVEHLAINEFPGLRRLWMPFHRARPGDGRSRSSLMARLSRALIDDGYEDDDRWVKTARRLFFGHMADWAEQSVSHALGSVLAEEFSRKRTSDEPAATMPQPGYRDDHAGLWDGVERNRLGEGTDRVFQGAKPGGHSVTGSGTESELDGLGADNREGKPASASSRRDAVRQSPLPVPIRYQEWDYLIGRDRPAWCTLFEKPAAEGDARRVDEVLERNHDLVNRVKHLVRAVQVRRPSRLKHRLDGDRLDLDAGIDATIDLRSSLAPDPRVYSAPGRRHRDLSVLVLLDLSQSTNDMVPNAGTSVLELAREAAALLADAMERIGDSFAIHGFSSNGRHDVGYYRFKEFDRPYGELAKSRLAGMTGQLSTRMGTALRHAGQYLYQRRANKKLVLLITDGEPSDIDVHDSQYLMFDARKAVEELTRDGIYTYCMSLDPRGDRYVSRIFGMRNWTVVDHLRRLPEKLPLLYMRLTH